jgi:release factor glutamine methyltransferase
VATIAALIDWGIGQLTESNSARIDAEIILAFILKQNRTYLYTWSDREVLPEGVAHYQALIKQRAAGEPVAYLVGSQPFWSFELKVTPATLIPRPETELLVEQALALIPETEPLRVADLGTGSGAIALAIASERPAVAVVATDQSEQALHIARENAVALGVTNIEFRLGSWTEPLAAERFNLIISNPPYVEPESHYLQQGDLRFEPESALIGADADGLGDIRHIIQFAADHLHAAGWLLLEHGAEQGSAVREVLERNDFEAIETLKDLAGLERVTIGRSHKKS